MPAILSFPGPRSGDPVPSGGRIALARTAPSIGLPGAGRDPRHAVRGAHREPAPGCGFVARWPGPPERRAFTFDETASGAIEGVLIPYGVPIRIGGVFEEIWEPHCLLLNNVRVNIRHDWHRPFAEFGRGLRTKRGDDAMRVVLTLRDTPEARRARTLVRAGKLTAFSAELRVVEEEWPAPDRRIVHQALLTGLALVDRPGHETALIEEVRARLEAGEPAPFRRRRW